MSNYNYGKKSLSNIETTTPTMQELCHRAMSIANKSKLNVPDFGISCGKREAEEQNELYQIGRTTAGSIVTQCDGYTKLSIHQSGNAIDFYAVIDGKANYDVGNLAMIAACFYQAAMELGLTIVWGGLWKSFTDAPHIEIIT